MEDGILYIVATPIGNLGDITGRALQVLAGADLICAEDTRHSKHLLSACGIAATQLLSLHEHNEAQRISLVLERLRSGNSVALISDAGTPLISDPGYRLVTACHEAGLRVSPVPGPSALTAALSVAGLPTDRFLFAGFPPAKDSARRQWFGELAAREETLVFYESRHRITASLQAMAEAFGGARRLTLLREITKQFETVLHGTLDEVLARVGADPNQQRGEFVLVVGGAPVQASGDEQARQLLALLLPDVGVKRAAEIAAGFLGEKKNRLYKLALAMGQEKS
ncbi:16S rRNA (cytidine(1402)-2'-O)-methyltransferase [Granulosicoccaceae sp. 1_MG-2023]|nr:16S rRNA (cytidine(1402)-2'-O)-methyltransferase [Granulosicoccaceae sp. 1_MG-2023]